MKCEMCGGEVDSQALNCEYCGADNEEGIAFQKEVYLRIKRNKLLAPILLKQHSPELIQKLLTRLIIIGILLNILFFFITVMLYLYMDRPSNREPFGNSYAKFYEKDFTYTSEYHYLSYWNESLMNVIDYIQTGEAITSYKVERLVNRAFDVMTDENLKDELREETMLQIHALFQGILGLTQEEMQYFQQYDPQYKYSKRLDPRAAEALFLIVKSKLNMEE